MNRTQRDPLESGFNYFRFFLVPSNLFLVKILDASRSRNLQSLRIIKKKEYS